MIFAVTAYLHIALVFAKEINPIPIIRNELNVSDEKLVVNPQTFINYNGPNKPGLRMYPKYHTPSERAINIKIVDLMKQSLYDTQDKMMELSPVLDKYRNDPSTRMAFIFNRLRQLIIDMRRVYTLAVRWRKKKLVFDQVHWYLHCARKFVDVMYIVDHVLDSHVQYLKTHEWDRSIKG